MNPLPIPIIHSTGSQSEVPGPAISASPGYLLETYSQRLICVLTSPPDNSKLLAYHMGCTSDWIANTV